MLIKFDFFAGINVYQGLKFLPGALQTMACIISHASILDYSGFWNPFEEVSRVFAQGLLVTWSQHAAVKAGYMSAINCENKTAGV